MRTITQPRRATVFADQEIAHLEAMLKGLRRHTDALSRLPADYWRSRILQIETTFSLVETQRGRLATLQLALDVLDPQRHVHARAMSRHSEKVAA